MKRTAYCCKCHQTTNQTVFATAPDRFASECDKCGTQTDVSQPPKPFTVNFLSDSRIFNRED